MVSNKELGIPHGNTGTKRKKYSSNKEKRGMQKGENVAQRSFWNRHKMDDIINKTPEELEVILDQFFDAYEKDQLGRNRNWWYPTLAKMNINQVRNKRTNIDKAPKIY